MLRVYLSAFSISWFGGWHLFFRAWPVAWEVQLPGIGVDKVCPKSFFADNLELVFFLFLMLGNEDRADSMCVAPHFLRDELRAFSLWVFLTSLRQNELCPLGGDRGGTGQDSVCWIVGPFYLCPGLVNVVVPFPCVFPQVACALCEMLSGSLCQEAIQELYPRLLLAVLCHLYWVIEQNAPQKMVVYTKNGGPGNKSKPFDPTR